MKRIIIIKKVGQIFFSGMVNDLNGVKIYLRMISVILLFSFALILSGCSVLQDREKMYEAHFGPDNKALSLCEEPIFAASKDIGRVLKYRRSGVVCPSYKNAETIALQEGIGDGLAWGRYDGGFGLAGTAFSIKSSTDRDRALEYGRERKRLNNLSDKSVRDHVRVIESFVSHGLKWEVQEHRFYIDQGYTASELTGGTNFSSNPALESYEIAYVYRDPDGWWLTVRGRFDGRMFSYPDILASRLRTLRQIVETVELEPLDNARIECSVEKKDRQRCRYRMIGGL